MAVADEGDCYVNALQQTNGVNAAENEAAFVEGLGPLGRGANADCREWMPNRSKERRLFRQSATVGNHGESVHLETVVVMETEGLMLDDTSVELESTSLQALTAARVAAIEDRHIVLLRHLVDCRE